MKHRPPRELWLEFGHLQEKNYHDMCWYNEGRWQELPYFISKLWQWRDKKQVYFFWRFGTKNHYIRGR